jgi:hypothetical protein
MEVYQWLTLQTSILYWEFFGTHIMVSDIQTSMVPLKYWEYLMVTEVQTKMGEF